MKQFQVINALGDIIAKCRKESHAIHIANTRTYETKVCMTIVNDNDFKPKVRK